VAESDVTQICGSRTALQTGRHELRRPVNLVADCDDRRCFDDEVTDPERVSGDRGFQAAALRVSVACSTSELSATGCSKHTTSQRLSYDNDVAIVDRLHLQTSNDHFVDIMKLGMFYR